MSPLGPLPQDWHTGTQKYSHIHTLNLYYTMAQSAVWPAPYSLSSPLYHRYIGILFIYLKGFYFIFLSACCHSSKCVTLCGSRCTDTIHVTIPDLTSWDSRLVSGKASRSLLFWRWFGLQSSPNNGEVWKVHVSVNTTAWVTWSRVREVYRGF